MGRGLLHVGKAFAEQAQGALVLGAEVAGGGGRRKTQVVLLELVGLWHEGCAMGPGQRGEVGQGRGDVFGGA